MLRPFCKHLATSNACHEVYWIHVHIQKRLERAVGMSSVETSETYVIENDSFCSPQVPLGTWTELFAVYSWCIWRMHAIHRSHTTLHLIYVYILARACYIYQIYDLTICQINDTHTKSWHMHLFCLSCRALHRFESNRSSIYESYKYKYADAVQKQM